MTSKKMSGSYYTPQDLANYVVYRLFKEGDYKFPQNIDVLEPSVGEGMFIDTLFKNTLFNSKINKPILSIDAVEIDEKIAQSVRQKNRQVNPKLGNVNVIHENYLSYFLKESKKYDLIIGNPPYVRRRNLSKDQQDLCAEVHKIANLSPKKPANLWTSFLVGAKESLKDKGVVAFILPTDLLGVIYAEEMQQMLVDTFERIEIFTFNQIIFDSIEQDVVILMCSNGHGTTAGPKFFHIKNRKDLKKPKHSLDNSNHGRQSLAKWTNYVLTNKELNFIDSIHKKIQPKRVDEFCTAVAGTVTAANDYYIIKKSVVDQYRLEDLMKPMVRKSTAMPTALVLNKKDIQRKIDEDTPICFIDFSYFSTKSIPKHYADYIKVGEELGLQERFKMQLRHPWFVVPSIWTTEGFFTKRSNVFPRIIVNDAKAYVTDSFYRISMKDTFEIKNFAFSFYNTLTMIYAELEGRYYGGSVLELTPSEFRKLPIPYVPTIRTSDVLSLDTRMRKKSSIREILDFTDSLILIQEYGLSTSEVIKLRKIYTKLITRRMKDKTTYTGFV